MYTRNDADDIFNQFVESLTEDFEDFSLFLEAYRSEKLKYNDVDFATHLAERYISTLSTCNTLSEEEVRKLFYCYTFLYKYGKEYYSGFSNNPNNYAFLIDGHLPNQEVLCSYLEIAFNLYNQIKEKNAADLRCYASLYMTHDVEAAIKDAQKNKSLENLTNLTMIFIVDNFMKALKAFSEIKRTELKPADYENIHSCFDGILPRGKKYLDNSQLISLIRNCLDFFNQYLEDHLRYLQLKHIDGRFDKDKIADTILSTYKPILALLAEKYLYQEAFLLCIELKSIMAKNQYPLSRDFVKSLDDITTCYYARVYKNRANFLAASENKPIAEATDNLAQTLQQNLRGMTPGGSHL